MEQEFVKWGLPKNDVYWINHPNKNELTNELLSNVANFKNPQLGNPLTNGQISCTFKHFLCLKDIVDKNYEYGVIFEDNILFTGNIPDRINEYITQLNTLYPDWDIIFDSNLTVYNEGVVTTDCIVYPKTNEITRSSHGGSKCAHFYLITNKCAKKLFDHFLPFGVTSDFHMNRMFRELDIHSFWAEPPLSNIFPHESSCKPDFV